ncbi:MAG: HAMP domain-containing protein [Chloroflexi bacterium]|nr:HAMP domain-containing protein [Chloroflexota bacterium]
MTRTTPFLSSIQARLMVVVVAALVLMLGGLGTISWLAVRESLQRSLQERLALARANADHLDYVLSQGLATLANLASAPGLDLTGQDTARTEDLLHDVYVTSLFDDGVYLIDASGRVVAAEPAGKAWTGTVTVDSPPVREALSAGKPVVSNVYARRPGQMVVSAVMPVKRAGEVKGAIVGDIDPTGPVLLRSLRIVQLGRTGYIEVVDRSGVVVASSLPERVLQPSDHGDVLGGMIEKRETTSSTCHSGCHQGDVSPTKTTEVMAFAPLTLESAAWGVALRQSEEEALGPSRSLVRGTLMAGIPATLLSVALAWGMARSISKPVVSLTAAARSLSEGDLSHQITSSGNDEVATLSQSLEVMRSRLSSSLEEIKHWNTTLESKVEARTQELERLYIELRAKESVREDLLRKVITAQEEERKRLARDLHDDTSQTLAALVMALDTYRDSLPQELEQFGMKVDDIRNAAKRSLDSIRRIILDLRPSILDDLGLAPALRWYAETRLGQNGVKVHVETNDPERRLPGTVETALFRIVQEAVTNIARHAEADSAAISVDFQDDAVVVEVEDDGKGFDTSQAEGKPIRTFGLQGMRERVSLLGGRLDVESQPGSGTRIFIWIPIPIEEIVDDKDTHSNSR